MIYEVNNGGFQKVVSTHALFITTKHIVKPVTANFKLYMATCT